jgi:integrase
MAGKTGKTAGKLSALKVASALAPGLYGDGNGLYLKVDGDSKSWVLRFKIRGRARKFGLGPVHTVPLALARDKAAAGRRLLLDGIDPIEQRRAAKATALLEAAKNITFDKCSKQYIDANKAAWKSAKHLSEWSRSLQRYASPVFGKLAVADVDVGLVVRALQPIWTTKPETAARTRGRIETVLDYAKAHGYRAGENPARVKGNLAHILPPHNENIKTVKHHAALPHADVAALMVKLAARHEVSAAALAFAILTAARSGAEVTGAQWDEIDLDAKLWTVPGERMKAGKEHKVPLSDAAIAVLIKLKSEHGAIGFVFPGRKRNRGLSDTRLPRLLRSVGVVETVHGFRSSFRDWAAEQTAFPREVAEACLAHLISNKTEAAYLRTEFLEKRRKLLNAWARYISAPAPAKGGKVVAIGRTR